MIKINVWTLKDYKCFNVSLVDEAVKIIRKFKRKGYFVEWVCDYPEDNQDIWQTL